MQILEARSEARPAQTLRLITKGRITGTAHITELRYARVDESFFVLSGGPRSDWVLNALAEGSCKIEIGELVYRVTITRANPVEEASIRKVFREKYGSQIIDQWYRNSQGGFRLTPNGPPSLRLTARGEHETRGSFREWKGKGRDYYRSVQDAFDSASEEYDYTIRRNYINSWIRKRSINQLYKITHADDVLLEIGCGTGAEALRISEHVKRIVATDISEKMLDLLKQKVEARRLGHKIIAAKARAAEIDRIKGLLPDGEVRVAYSFNGALNCEPDIDHLPFQIASVIQEGGYFLCSIRNTICLSEALAHSLVLQFNKTNARKDQPNMVSVGGMDIPSFYYSPTRFADIFRPHFRVRTMIGLPAFLPPAYLSDYYLRTGSVRTILEKMEVVLGDRFPFNRLGDQTLFVFQRK